MWTIPEPAKSIIPFEPSFFLKMGRAFPSASGNAPFKCAGACTARGGWGREEGRKEGREGGREQEEGRQK